jgi:hypothetical protein
MPKVPAVAKAAERDRDPKAVRKTREKVRLVAATSYSATSLALGRDPSDGGRRTRSRSDATKIPSNVAPSANDADAGQHEGGFADVEHPVYGTPEPGWYDRYETSDVP